jgi:hypothetical protein
VLITATDKLTTVCSYVNNGPQTLNYGESWDNETCFSAMYLAPNDGQSLFTGVSGP